MKDSEADFPISSRSPRWVAMTTEGHATVRTCGVVNSTARFMRRPQHVVRWRMEGIVYLTDRTGIPIFRGPRG
jgi:hypothetical protein